jgi:hypothetical protein
VQSVLESGLAKLLSLVNELFLAIYVVCVCFYLFTAPYVPPPAVRFKGFEEFRLEENGMRPCRISSNDQYRIDRMNVAR